jgi:tetraacyldisaccharide 4'-kinase
LIAEAKRDGLALVTTEKDLARLSLAGELAGSARPIVPFAVTLEFEDAVALRKFITARLFQVRQKRFRTSH